MDRVCEGCGETFELTSGPGRPRRKCVKCSPPERRNEREPDPPQVHVLPAPPPIRRVEPSLGPDVAATTVQALEDAGRLDTPLGAIAVRLATMLATGDHVASGAAALSKELRAALGEALAGAGKKADSLDELSKRRGRKASGA